LIDAGRIIAAYTDGYKGKAPILGHMNLAPGKMGTAGLPWEADSKKN